ncbi:hypothetical protein [Brachybacterium massiliense]|uniref:hypothetical protein n=1 Tax=Brachybacterium massiliense TaxID=1755098 RepID=UPI000B3BC15A|nr:hypothetical protein [Brachybacterium massiliense]
MTYTPRSWADGELVTAEDLNRIEQGIEATDADLDGKADTTDPRLSDARPPTAHQHPVSDVTGLQAALDALGASTGVRVIDLIDGTVWQSRAGMRCSIMRTGPLVMLSVVNVLAAASGASSTPQRPIPVGFRPAQEVNATLIGGSAVSAARLLVQTSGSTIFATPGPASGAYAASAMWITADPWPSTLPGDPA